MLYVREDIPSNLLATDEKNHIESFYVELNLRNEKWLINCSYNPNKTMICNHLDALSTYLDLYSTTYEKILILDNFNAGIEEIIKENFDIFADILCTNMNSSFKSSSFSSCLKMEDVTPLHKKG